MSIPKQMAGDWREELGIEIGMTKEEAFEKVREWQGARRTCARCMENEYGLVDYCPMKLVCEEAKNGTTEDRADNLGKEPRGGIRGIKVNLVRNAAKRVSLAKHRG